MSPISQHSSREGWLEERRQGVTASEVPGLLGVYPSEAYKASHNPYELWLKKTNRLPLDGGDPPEELRVRLAVGRAMEEPVASYVERSLGVTLQDPGDYTMISDGLLSATPDRLITARRVAEVDNLIAQRAVGVVEIKSAFGSLDEWVGGPALRAAVVQAHVAMDVIAALRADSPSRLIAPNKGVVAVVGNMGWDLRVHEFGRRKKLTDLIRSRAEEFWEFVKADEPPDERYLAGGAGVAKSLSTIFEPHPGETVDLPPWSTEVMDRLVAISAEIRALEAEKSGLENRIRREMESAETGVVPGGDLDFRWRVEPRKERVVPASSPRVLRRVKKSKKKKKR